jgi:hypothetical protein
MSTLTTNLWKAAPNTKVPALSHYFSYRITGAAFNASATTVFTLPSNYVSPGQLAPVAGVPSSYAATFTNPDPNSEPQQLGATFVPTNFCVRNPNGSFVSSGTSAVGTATISLFNPNVSSINTATGVVTRAAGTAANNVNTYAGFSWTASGTGGQIWTSETVWDANLPANSTFTATAALPGSPTVVATPVAETATSLPGIALSQVRFGLGDSLAVNVNVTGYVAGSTGALPTATATGFTVDVFGYWIQGI